MSDTQIILSILIAGSLLVGFILTYQSNKKNMEESRRRYISMWKYGDPASHPYHSGKITFLKLVDSTMIFKTKEGSLVMCNVSWAQDWVRNLRANGEKEKRREEAIQRRAQALLDRDV